MFDAILFVKISTLGTTNGVPSTPLKIPYSKDL